ncbi:substrate-binding periplasmic protein [Acinetobacter sp. c3-l95]|uniref:substrate-binding periplasmic protein n=1 Tax=Acinetobacter sp. c3-l95 TaxID=3342804 RepID=UPI0035BADCD5
MNSQFKYVLPVIMASLTACSDNSPGVTSASTEASNASAAADSKFVSKLPADAPTLKVGTTGVFSPYSFSDEYGNLQGYDIDLIHEVGERAGFKTDIFSGTMQDTFDDLEKGKFDMAIGGFVYTDERNNRFTLSKPYNYSPAAIMHLPDTKLTGLADLKDLKVATVKGVKQVNDLKKIGKTDFEQVDTAYLLYEGLIQKKYDAVTFKAATLYDLLKNNPDVKMEVTPYEDVNNPEAHQVVVLKKGNDELKAKIDKALDELKADGTIDRLEQKWTPIVAEKAKAAEAK